MKHKHTAAVSSSFPVQTEKSFCAGMYFITIWANGFETSSHFGKIFVPRWSESVFFWLNI